MKANSSQKKQIFKAYHLQTATIISLTVPRRRKVSKQPTECRTESIRPANTIAMSIK